MTEPTPPGPTPVPAEPDLPKRAPVPARAPNSMPVSRKRWPSGKRLSTQF